MIYSIYSPLEQFNIRPYLEIGSIWVNTSYISITNFTVYMVIALAIISILHIYSLNTNNTVLPTRYSTGVEGMYNTVRNMVISQLGTAGQIYIPFVYALFLIILYTNWISMVPYNFAIMAQLVFTLSMSFTIWLGVTILGISTQGKAWWGLFLPAGTIIPLIPILIIIETISYIARSISLGLRLGANILAGHLLVIILAGLIYDFMSISIINAIVGIIPLSIVLGIVILETAICWIQAYVFCILTSSYIKDALYSH